jgi:multiple sugar transport system permease protein
MIHRLGRFRERRAAWFFAAPAVLALFLLIVFPIGVTIWLSTQDWFLTSIVPPKFVGLANYVSILTGDERFRNALGLTFYFSAFAVCVETVLGVVVAVVFNREFLGKGLVRTLFLFPMVATPVAIALVWTMMYNPSLGVLNYFLRVLGLPPALWTADPTSVIPSLVLVDAWQWTPFITLIVLSGLSALPVEPFEAAVIDGASGWQSFWYVTLPLLRPTIMIAVLFRTVDALKTFDFIYVMTGGGPGNASETLNLYIFKTGFTYFHVGYASSLLVIFFAIVLGMSLILIRARRVEL